MHSVYMHKFLQPRYNEGFYDSVYKEKVKLEKQASHGASEGRYETIFFTTYGFFSWFDTSVYVIRFLNHTCQ